MYLYRKLIPNELFNLLFVLREIEGDAYSCQVYNVVIDIVDTGIGFALTPLVQLLTKPVRVLSSEGNDRSDTTLP